MNNKISKTYLVADTHFFHEAMVEHGIRPPNFTELIINQWKATVHPQDVVCHLGDVIWGKQEQLISVMNSLPGTKILIRGNHDKNHSNNWFIQAGFAAVFDKAQIARCILSHVPVVLSKEELEKDIINVFGHFHNNPVTKWEPELRARITHNHYLFSLEEIGYKPISLQKIRRRQIVKNAKKILEGKDGVNRKSSSEI